jgi:hypothetical protein
MIQAFGQDRRGLALHWRWGYRASDLIVVLAVIVIL